MKNSPDIRIVRTYYSDCTLGRLTVTKTGFNCFCLELPWKNNNQDVSCIPEGKYLARKRYSQQNGWVLELMHVVNRTYIQIHVGNYTSDILGCIVPGDSIKYLNKDSIPDVTNSGKTHKTIYDMVPDTLLIEITHSDKEYKYVF